MKGLLMMPFDGIPKNKMGTVMINDNVQWKSQMLI